MNSEKVFSVSEINSIIKDLFDEIPLFNNVEIKGEISNYKLYPSGHRYFTIKDAESSLKCVLFKGTATKDIDQLKDGKKLILTGRLTVYQRDGVYQLIVSRISSDGIGDLYIEFERLKNSLNEEGLFDSELKKNLPRYPKKICLITSPAGAAVRDMIRILHERFPVTDICVLPVRVQGIEAPDEISEAIDYANLYQVADLIITGRGGGSIEDLWAFNDEKVARAIFQSKIPVISAVGHEPDITISDFVADVRASTPSNAAEIAVPHHKDIMQLLNHHLSEMESCLQNTIYKEKQRLLSLAIKKELTDPLYPIRDKQIKLDYLQEKLSISIDQLYQRKLNKFQKVVDVLDAVSPLKIISRGYSITQDSKQNIVNDILDVNVGDKISVIMKNGELLCNIEGIKENNGKII